MQIKTAKYLLRIKPNTIPYPTPKWIENFNFNNIDPTIALSMIRQDLNLVLLQKVVKALMD